MEQRTIHDPSRLSDFRATVRTKLAALWTSLMFLYIYADYFQLKAPGVLENTMNLETPVGPTTPELLIGFSILLIIPSLILIIVSGIKDEWQAFFVLFNVIEVIIFSMIIWQAWNWPKAG